MEGYKMGLAVNAIKWLELMKYSYNVNYEKIAILGRQNLYVSKEEALEFSPKDNILQEDGYSELFYRYLGAKKIVSCDYSNYEKANYIHDFNDPIDEAEEEQYSVVLDGGSLEHIFNFPVAIHNLMKMVDIGGHLIIMTPTNNSSGHGFYQFSADLFYQLLCNNGFVVEDITWCDYREMSEKKMETIHFKLYETNCLYSSYDLEYQSSLFICAKKISKTPFKFNSVMQGYYLNKWNDISKGWNTEKRQYYDIDLEWKYKKTGVLLKPQKILCWGCGNDFINYLEEINYFKDNADVEIIACIDTNNYKQGGNYRKIPIVSPEVIDKSLFDNIVITSSKYEKEIRKELIEIHKVNDKKIWNLKRYKYVMGARIY